LTSSQPIKTLLFDLDGTLIKLDMDQFLPKYFKALGKHCARNIDPKLLVEFILKSIEAMITSLDFTLTNQQVFEQDFLIRSGLTADVVLPLFDSFYQEVFPSLAGQEVQNPAGIEAVKLAVNHGLEVVVATNPVFPLTAIRQRLIWGGLQDIPFTLVTAYENMHSCKPSLEYYREILTMLGRRPEECWMVGNDMAEDMVAGELGLNTFLVEDYLIASSDQYTPTRIGRMTDLPKFVASLIS
jgi:FMN phosphatase YigB (HAD superfamily)